MMADYVKIGSFKFDVQQQCVQFLCKRSIEYNRSKYIIDSNKIKLY